MPLRRTEPLPQPRLPKAARLLVRSQPGRPSAPTLAACSRSSRPRAEIGAAPPSAGPGEARSRGSAAPPAPSAHALPHRRMRAVRPAARRLCGGGSGWRWGSGPPPLPPGVRSCPVPSCPVPVPTSRGRQRKSDGGSLAGRPRRGPARRLRPSPPRAERCGRAPRLRPRREPSGAREAADAASPPPPPLGHGHRAGAAGGRGRVGRGATGGGGG